MANLYKRIPGTHLIKGGRTTLCYTRNTLLCTIPERRPMEIHAMIHVVSFTTSIICINVPRGQVAKVCSPADPMAQIAVFGKSCCCNHFQGTMNDKAKIGFGLHGESIKLPKECAQADG